MAARQALYAAIPNVPCSAAMALPSQMDQ